MNFFSVQFLFKMAVWFLLFFSRQSEHLEVLFVIFKTFNVFFRHKFNFEKFKKLLKIFFLLSLIKPGDTQVVETPRREMEVIKGQMVVLHAWYSPNSDVSENTVMWQFNGNGSKPVRSWKEKNLLGSTGLLTPFWPLVGKTKESFKGIIIQYSVLANPAAVVKVLSVHVL